MRHLEFYCIQSGGLHMRSPFTILDGQPTERIPECPFKGDLLVHLASAVARESGHDPLFQLPYQIQIVRNAYGRPIVSTAMICTVRRGYSAALCDRKNMSYAEEAVRPRFDDPGDCDGPALHEKWLCVIPNKAAQDAYPTLGAIQRYLPTETLSLIGLIRRDAKSAFDAGDFDRFTILRELHLSLVESAGGDGRCEPSDSQVLARLRLEVIRLIDSLSELSELSDMPDGKVIFEQDTPQAVRTVDTCSPVALSAGQMLAMCTLYRSYIASRA